MHGDTVDQLAETAVAKLAGQRASLGGHFARSMLAGMYVGAAVVLALVVGASLASAAPHLVTIAMGLSFGCALTFVVFAGAELFTGSNVVLTLGVLRGRASVRELGANWGWTWLGNLAGSSLLAVMVVRSSIFDADAVRAFVLGVAERKVALAPEALFWRAVLANWLVCLGVWMAARTRNDAAKVLLIWWCMFAFVACGFEHCVANMTALAAALLLPGAGETGVTLASAAYNLALATLGNIVGGAVLVAGMYWVGSRGTQRRANASTQATLGLRAGTV